MKRVVSAALLIAIGLTASAWAQESGPLNAARDLYAAARYDEALALLNGLRTGDGIDRRSVEQYRSLCLLALGRPAEAENAIAAVVSADPLYRPAEAETSPRVRAMFADVRKRMLPEIATSRYVAAKATYDRQDWAAAEHQFRAVLSLIDDPDTAGKLSDLRVLTVGFLELSARAAAPPPVPKPELKPEPKPEASAAPMAGPTMTSRTVSPTRDRSAASAETGPMPGRIYGADDKEVVPPVTVRQAIPSVPANIVSMVRPRGLLEVVVDELGRVVGMTMRAPIHPAYDAQLLAAAGDWKYRPATFNGRPVRYRKLIQVTVKR